MSSEKIPENQVSEPGKEKPIISLEFPSEENILEFLKRCNIIDEEAQKALKKILRGFEKLKEITSPTNEDLKDQLAGAFTFINNIFEKRKEGDKADEVTGELKDMLTGEVSEAPPAQVLEKEELAKPFKEVAATGKEKEELKETEKKSKERVVEREKIKTKVEIFRELKKTQGAISNLQKKWFALGEKWDQFQTRLNNFAERLESEELTAKLVQEWEELNFQINEDIKLEQEKAKKPEVVVEKKDEEKEKRISRINTLKAEIEALRANTALTAKLREFEYELEKITEKINSMSSGEELVPLDEEIFQVEVNLNKLIDTLKVEDISEEVKKILEQRFAYLNIDQREIFELLTEADMRNLRALLLEKGEKEKVSGYLKDLINQIVVESEKQEFFDNQKIAATAEAVNKILRETFNAEAQRKMVRIDIRKISRVAGKTLKNYSIYFGAGTALAALGLPALGVGAAAVGFSALSFGLRKFEQRKKEKNASKIKADFDKELEQEKGKIITEFFEDINKARGKFSGIISNEIRKQTAEEPLKAIKDYQATEMTAKEDSVKARLDDYEKGLFAGTLTMIKAEYPSFPEEQQEQMATVMTMALSQHERNEYQSKKKLEELENSDDKIVKFLNKFNAWRSGTIERKPDGVEQKVWDKVKLDLIAITLGTGVGLAVRTSDVARICLGSLTGLGVGLNIADAITKSKLEKQIIETENIINEAEAVIKDIKFSAEELPEFRKSVALVQSRLELGILDSNQILKSRAENFIHNVRQLEIANQKVLEDLLKQQEENREKLKRKIEEDIAKITGGKKTIRNLTMIGGALLGGITFGALASLTTEWGREHLGIPQDGKEFYQYFQDNDQDEIDQAAKSLHLTGEKVLSRDEYLENLETIKQGNCPELTRDLYRRVIWKVRNDWGGLVKFRDEDGDGLPEMMIAGKFKQAENDQDVIDVLKKGDQSTDISSDVDAGGNSDAATDVKQPPEAESKKSQSEVLENKIDSSELGRGRHDSVWYSTYQMVKESAAKLGFSGKEDELDKWAEKQTNLLVNNLDKKTEGGIKDLVHDGDYVFLEQKDGKWELGFRADSGIEPSYLPEVQKVKEINLEDLKVEDLTREDTGWLRHLESKVKDLEQEQQEDLDRTEEAFGERIINREQYNQSLEEIKSRYGIRKNLSVYQKMLEDRQAGKTSEGAEVSMRKVEPEGPVEGLKLSPQQQGAFEILSKKDPAGQGITDYEKYQKFLGTPEHPNQGMIQFISTHREISYSDLNELVSYNELINSKLNKFIPLDRIYEFQNSGYTISGLSEQESSFSPESTIIFQKQDGPAIYIDKNGSYGYEINGELSKVGEVSARDINPTMLSELEDKYERLSTQEELTEEPKTELEEESVEEKIPEEPQKVDQVKLEAEGSPKARVEK